MKPCRTDARYGWEIRDQYKTRDSGRHVSITEEGLLDKTSTVVLSGPLLQEIFDEALKLGIVKMPLTPQQRLDKLTEELKPSWLHKLVSVTRPDCGLVVHVKLRSRAPMKEILLIQAAVKRTLGDDVELSVTFQDDGDLLRVSCPRCGG